MELAGDGPNACVSTQSRSVPGYWQGNNGPVVELSTLFCPGLPLFPSAAGLSVWLLLPLLVGRLTLRGTLGVLPSSKTGQKYIQVNRGEAMSNEPIERNQGGSLSRSILQYCQLSVEVNYFSRSVCRLTFPLWRFFLLPSFYPLLLFSFRLWFSPWLIFPGSQWLLHRSKHICS